MTAAKQDKTPSFEKSMERLEAIVGDMEGGELSLDIMIQRFEEGQTLIKSCAGKLDEVERKIEKLLTKEGDVVTEPFATTESTPPVDLADADDGGGELLF